MAAFLILLRVRLFDALRSKSSIGFVLFFPIALLVTLGLVFMNGHPFERRYVAVVDDGTHGTHGTGGAAIERSVAALAPFEEVRVGRERTEAEALGKLRARMASAVILASPGGEGVTLRVGERDRIFGGGLASALPLPARLEVVSGPRFGYVFYLFPGIVVFSVLTAGLFGMGYPMALFRQNLFLKKLATTPLPKITFVGANVAARSLLVLAQVLLLLVVAHFGFGMPMSFSQAGFVLAISALGVLAFLGAGFALATVIRNAELLVDVIGAINLPLVFFSEIFFPLESLPRALAMIGEALPSTQMVRLLRAVLLYGVTDPARLWGGLLVIALWAIATFVVSLVAFRWHE